MLNVKTAALENINGTEIDIKDDFDMQNHNILNVNNINTITVNNQIPVFGGGGTNGKYSQICLPPDEGKTSGNGQVMINGDNTDETTAISIVDGNSIGSLIFTPSDLSLGASYNIKIAGAIKTNSQNMGLNISFYLGTNLIYSTRIYDEDIQIDNLNDTNYVYECETDFTIYESGSTGKLYSNGQIFYVRGTNQDNLRGSSSELEVNGIDLSANLALDIKIKWETSADIGEQITNKMFRVTRMF
jgi:hypothetical protein